MKEGVIELVRDEVGRNDADAANEGDCEAERVAVAGSDAVGVSDLVAEVLREKLDD